MIALLLGSFNPIHNGHLAIAHYTIEQGVADEVWFVVSPQNPLKDIATLAPYENRTEMVRIAIAHEKRFKLCEIEASLPQPSYTINTITELKRQYSDDEFLILAGSDIKEQLPLWREYKKLTEMVRFVIYPRGENQSNCTPEIMNAPLFDIDSTACRNGLYPLNDSVKEALPVAVQDYIFAHKLYQSVEQELYERGCDHYKNGRFGDALNDFNEALSIKTDFEQARQMKDMTESILNFRHTDIYNP